MSSSDPNVWVGSISRERARESFRVALNRTLQADPSAVRSVVIKINLCDYRRAETGATTDPQLLGALLDELHERFPGAKLSILENDATSVEIWSAYRILGIEAVARKHDAELLNVAEHPWVTRRIPKGIVFQELEVPEILETCDLFVNLAKLKTNALTRTTGVLKNVFALLRQKRKVVLHGRIDEVLQDMNQVLIPDLCLIDGMIGMETIGGPAFGRPKHCGLLVAGKNPVAVDACAARIMGFRPLSVRHIKMCHELGLGPVDYRMETDIPGFNYKNYKFRFETWEYLLRNALRSRAGMST